MLSTLTVSYFLAIISAVLMLLTWRRYGRRNIVVTPYVLACCFLLVFCWTGQISAIASGLTDSIYASFVLFAGVVAFLIGFVSFSHSQIFAAQHFQKRLVRDVRASYFYGGVSLLLLALAISTYRYQGLPPVAHVVRELATGHADVDELAGFSKDSRLSLSSGHWTHDTPQRGKGIAGRFLRIAFPYLLCICLGMHLYTRRRHWLYYSVIVAGITTLYVGGDGTRAPLANAAMVVVVFFSYVKPITYRHLTFAASAVFVLLIVMTLTSSKGLGYFHDLASFREIIEPLLLRFGANGFDDVAVIELVGDNQLEYHCGLLFLEQLLAPIPGVRLQDIPFDLRLWHLMDPYSTEHVFATTTLLGLIYLDGGILGVLVVYGLLGVLIARIQVPLFSGPKEISSMAVRASLTCAIGRVMVAGLLYVAVDVVLIVVIHYAFCHSSRWKGAIPL